MKFPPSSAAGSKKYKAQLCAFVGVGTLLTAPAGLASAQEDMTEDAPRRLNAVIVEATRRGGVTVQDVPVSVTAYDSVLLEDAGVDRLNDLVQIAPYIQISQSDSSGAGTAIAIRGIGTGANNPGFEPAVGVVIDGVYRTRTGIALSEMPELSGIEVLRGPQGTLFGRNTSAGVVSIRTAGPQHEPEASVGLSAGNYGLFSTEAMVTGPFSENVAGRLDMKLRKRDGYIDDVNSDREFNNLDRFLLRGQLKWEAGDASLRLIGDVGQTNEDCCVGLNFNEGPTAQAVNIGAAMAGLTGIADSDLDDYEVALSPNREVYDDVEEWGVSAEYEDRFGSMEFTSITAWRDWQLARGQDVDFSGIDRSYRDGTSVTDKVFTQEVRLQDTYGMLDWLVGAFYMNEELGYDDTIRTGTQGNLYIDLVAYGAAGGQLFGSLDPTGMEVPALLGNIDPGTGAPAAPGTPGTVPFFLPGSYDGAGQNDDFDVTTNAFAVFTHNEVALTDRLTATLGGRLNYEEKELSYELDSVAPVCDFFLAAPSVAQSLGSLALLACNPAINSEYNGTDAGSFDDTVLTGTAKLAYEFTPDVMGYVSYARGYKAGGYNLDRSGFDSVIFGGDGAQPDDLQFDAETVDSYEFGWKARFGQAGATLNGALFYQDLTDFQENYFSGTNFRVFNADVESYGLEVDGSIQPADGLTLQGGYAWTRAERKKDLMLPNGDGTFTLLGPGGVQLPLRPEHVVTASGTYLHALSPDLRGLIHLNARYASDHAVTELSRGLTDNDAFALFGGRIGVQAADGRWEVSVFGENITDEYYNTAAIGVPEQTGTNSVYPDVPAMYGAELKLSF